MSTYEPPELPEPTEPSGADEPFSVATAWNYGWNKFLANVGQVLLAVLVVVAVFVAFQLVGFVLRARLACDPAQTVTATGVTQQQCGLLGAPNVVYWAVSLAGWLVSLIIGAGIVRAALEIVEGRALSAREVLTPYKLGQVVVASLLVTILTFVGFVLCFIPGLLVMYFTSYTLFFLMDKDETSAIDAITESFYFTRDHAGQVLLWFLLSVVTWVVGACLCFVGLIAAVPVVLIGTAYTYKRLDGLPVAP